MTPARGLSPEGPWGRDVLDPRSRSVLGSRSLRIELGETDARWTCTYCGRRFPVDEGWGVAVDRPDDGPGLRYIVCGMCAPIFTMPPALEIDLTRMRSEGSSAFDDLVDRVEEIARARGHPGAETVTVRGADLRGYAAEHGVTPMALVRFLVDEELASPV